MGTLADPTASEVLTALVRAAASEQPAADMVRQAVTERLLPPLAQAIGRPNAELRAALAASQIVGLTMARHVVGIRPLLDLPDQHLTDHPLQLLPIDFVARSIPARSGVVQQTEESEVRPSQ